MNYFLILTGLLFFINPCVGIVDILPDFIGALIIIIAIGQYRLLNSKNYKTFKALWYYMFIEAAKFGLSFLKFKESVTILLFTFSFAILEAYILFVIITNLIGGFETMCLRYGTFYESYNTPKREKKINKYKEKHPDGKKEFKTSGQKYGLDAMKKSLIVYTFVRILLCTLPEFTSLDAGITVRTVISNMSEFRMMFYVLVAPIVITWMIVTIVRTVNTFRVINADKQMKENSENAYTELEENRQILIRTERQKNAYIILFFAMIFSVFFFIDGYDLIPKVLTSLALVFFYLYEDCEKKKKVSGIILCVINALAYGFYVYAGRNHYIYKTEVFEFDVNNAACIAEMDRLTVIMNISIAVSAIAVGALLVHAMITLYRCCCNAYSYANELQVKKAIDYATKKFTPIMIIIPINAAVAVLYAFFSANFNLMSFALAVTEALSLMFYFLYKVKDDDDFV